MFDCVPDCICDSVLRTSSVVAGAVPTRCASSIPGHSWNGSGPIRPALLGIDELAILSIAPKVVCRSADFGGGGYGRRPSTNGLNRIVKRIEYILKALSADGTQFTV